MARKKITAEFKFKVTLEALKERCTLEELGAETNVAVLNIVRS